MEKEKSEWTKKISKQFNRYIRLNLMLTWIKFDMKQNDW